MVPRIFRLSRGTGCGDPEIRGLGQMNQIFWDHMSTRTEFVGNYLPKVIHFMGIICPGGQEDGDQKSGDQMGSKSNASQPKNISL